MKYFYAVNEKFPSTFLHEMYSQDVIIISEILLFYVICFMDIKETPKEGTLAILSVA